MASYTSIYWQLTYLLACLLSAQTKLHVSHKLTYMPACLPATAAAATAAVVVVTKGKVVIGTLGMGMAELVY